MSTKPKRKKPLSVTHPELADEWNYSRNCLYDPESITHGSTKKVWWVCPKGHEYQASPGKRSLGRGCPYCTNKKVLEGFNDLATTNPDLAEQWSTNNLPLTPKQVTSGSGKVVLWTCGEDHEWTCSVNNRSRGKGCPICANRRVLEGFNDLASQNPELAKEWSSHKNFPLTPEQVVYKSGKKVWWKCSKGHEWEATVATRAKGCSCPYCSGLAPVPGATDLSTTHPELCEELDVERNGEGFSSKVSRGSNKKAWWKCEEGHSWEAVVSSRVAGKGCPTCWSRTFVSKGEKGLLEYVKTLCPDTAGTYKNLIDVSEVDIYVPSKNIAIEYNGVYWHSEPIKGKTSHYDKWKACKDQGIQLIQIWEDEWRDKPEIVKTMLAHKLGHTTKNRIYARKTSVVELPVDMCQSFFELNHIQGYGGGSIKIGLEFEGNLVAAAVFRKRDKTTLELVRYATSENVIGGQSKILKNLKRLYPEFTSVVTFADHCVSNGNLYEALGFKKDAELASDYRYVVGANRVHKFNYRLKRFKEDPDLEYQEGLTERELAQLNGLQRVYDAGKTRYVLDLDLL